MEVQSSLPEDLSFDSFVASLVAGVCPTAESSSMLSPAAELAFSGDLDSLLDLQQQWASSDTEEPLDTSNLPFSFFSPDLSLTDAGVW